MPRGELVKSVRLPMGDAYEVRRVGKELVGSRINKLSGERVPPECRAYGMFILDEYIGIAALSDRDCLRGNGLYVKASYANWYKEQMAKY